jgi:undecaprenyl-phosphate galactose phosphotransferase/putative colanic acid biosynthesis UDP-glucose lipid carrier transferase
MLTGSNATDSRLETRLKNRSALLDNPDSLARRATASPQAGDGLAVNCPTQIDNRYVLRTKRLLDVIVAASALSITAPLMLVITALIMVESRGPAIFRQTRYGLHGKPFTIFKFRTMYVTDCPEQDQKQARRKDPRVTFVGSWLRRTSLDELPQLFNVILGDMSVVGPRPHPCWLDSTYATKIPGYTDRFVVKPGITGLAQVLGYRGETSDETLMARRLEFDREYIANSSFRMDLSILVLTVGCAWPPARAY